MINKTYPKTCKWCGGECKIIPKEKHWTKETKNKCTECGAFNQ